MPKILFLSDSHGQHREIPKEWLIETDWIIHAGDISSMGTIPQVADFLDWFSNVGNYKFRCFIAGNHDWIFEKNPSLAKSMIPKNVTYLESSEIVIDGIKIFGEPHQPEFCQWAFNVQRGRMKDYWSRVPEDVQLLISHGPPYGILDMSKEGVLCGCKELLERLPELKQLRVAVAGHIHEARGVFEGVDGQKIINASLLNRSYEMVNKPYVVDTDGWKIVSS